MLVRTLGVLVLFRLVATTIQAENPPPPPPHEDTTNDKQQQQQQQVFSSQLFAPSYRIHVQSPSHFPKPTRKVLMTTTTTINDDDDPVQVIVKPLFGVHRPDQDVIFAYAEGYPMEYYAMFLQTLTETGFTGDVVLAIADDTVLLPNVLDYLITYGQGMTNKPNVIVYQHALDCKNNGHTNTTSTTNTNTGRMVMRGGVLNPFQMCQIHHVYGIRNTINIINNNTTTVSNNTMFTPVKDPRQGRVVATIRYEWYWMWSLQYNPHSWIMLLDARDSYFQSNPFVDLPRHNNNDNNNNSTMTDGGLLYLFGENADATRLGKSRKNMKWIRNGYGEAVLQALKDKPTICSGSTMGEQVAIETYLRAMVNEHDECNIRMAGSDQGFHNYLYYSRKLSNAATIRKIVVWEQGKGIINNLGALRTKPFKDWGIYDPKEHKVYQWDKKTLSPVVHQWDRDGELHGWMTRVKHNQWKAEWEEQHTNKKQA